MLWCVVDTVYIALYKFRKFVQVCHLYKLSLNGTFSSLWELVIINNSQTYILLCILPHDLVLLCNRYTPVRHRAPLWLPQRSADRWIIQSRCQTSMSDIYIFITPFQRLIWRSRACCLWLLPTPRTMTKFVLMTRFQSPGWSPLLPARWAIFSSNETWIFRTASLL